MVSTVHTTGTVDWDADHTTQAITQVNGPISRFLVDTGTPVTANQPLLYVSSPDVATAISTYKKARNRQDYSKQTLDRSKDLLDHKVIATKDLEAAEQDYNDARAEVENDLQALKIFGVTQQEIDDAQRQGVADQSATGRALADRRHGGAETGYAGPGDSGRHDGLLHHQRHLHGLGAGPYLRSRSGIDSRRRCGGGDQFIFPQTFHGVVSYIGALIDPTTRTTSVRIVTKNPEGLLKKDMFVDAVIHTSSGRSLLAVPTSAILRNDENLPFVYVEVQPGKFAQRLVTSSGSSRATRRRS